MEAIQNTRQQIRETVASITPLDDMEANHQQQVVAWIDSGQEIFRLAKPATPPMHLVSYFVVADGPDILLVDHRQAELWLPSGGHVEPGEHPRRTVERESEEELELKAEFVEDAPLMVTVTPTQGISVPHTDVSLWYLIKGDRTQTLKFDEREFNSIRWFSPGEVPLNRADPHMGRFLRKYEMLLEKQMEERGRDREDSGHALR